MPYRSSRWFVCGSIALALIACVSNNALAQSATVISGRVTSAAGAPIGGASILVDATSTGTVSNDAGAYTLTVSAGRTGSISLTARHLGYRALRQVITLTGGPITVNFSLSPQAAELSEVVVTALSQQREKATIGTAQQTVSGDELGSQSPNLISAMSGKVAGLQISNSGNMGGSSRIVIRGAGSILGNNQPLFILDGQPISNNGFSTASASGGRDYGSAISDLNMDEVQSVTVLKGPNAAALYGSRASNGAVVITTKNGRNMLRGTKISYTSRLTMNQMSVFPSYQNGYGQGFGGEFNYVDGAGGGVNDGADESWGPKLDGRTKGCVFVTGTTNYDASKGCDQFTGKAQPWIAHPDNVRDYFRTGSTISNNINFSQSGEAAGARLSLTRDDEKGIVPNSSLGRLAGSLSANATFREKLTLAGSLQYTQLNGMNRTENGYTEGNPFMTFTWFGRQVDVNALKDKYRNAGSPYGFADGTLFNWNDNYHRNPWWQVYENTAPDSRERVIAQVSANYDFTPWLSGVVRTGGDSYRQTTQEDFAAGNIDRASASYNGGFTSNTGRARETNIEGLLTARRAFSNVELTANWGGNQRKNDSYNEGFSTNGILVPGIYNLANAGIAPTFTNSEFHSAVNSTYGSVIATLYHELTLEVTGRNDWSSTLPKKSDKCPTCSASYFYPSFNGSLLLSDLLPVLTSNGLLSYLKLRAGWSQVGSDAAPYQLQTQYSGNTNKFAGLAQYSLQDASANASLKPERTTGREAGVEFALLDDRITIDGTYYQKFTRDQILPLTIAPATGFSATVINAGQISNRGVEASITARLLRSRNGLQWISSFNMVHNKNRVDELAPGLTALRIATQWGAEIQAVSCIAPCLVKADSQPQPYGVLWGYGWQRDSATGKLLTTNGLPLPTTSKKILGNVNPDWTGGWANEFRYKRWALSSLLDIRHGGQNFSIGNWWGMYAGILESTLKGREVDWNKPGLIVDGIDKTTKLANTVTVTAEDYGHNLYPVPEAAVFNSGFVKLREVRLSWDLPSTLASKVYMSQVNVSLVGRNLKTWTSFPNYDPENATNSGNGGQGFDMGALPTTRNLGLNFTITP